MGQRVGEQLGTGRDVEPQAELVGERPSRAEQPCLVTEQSGDLLLQRTDGGVLTEDVVADLGLGHRTPHLGSRLGDRVGKEVGDPW